MLIYKITNSVNGKVYVCQTVRNDGRWQSYWGSGLSIRKAILKYGKENFKKEIIEICSNCKELNEREMFWIRNLNSKHPNGYNMTDGGDGIGKGNIPWNKNLTMDSHQSLLNAGKKISLKNKGRKVVVSKETCLKISCSRKGMKFSDEHKKNLSLAKIGKPMPESVRKKVSDGMKRYKRSLNEQRTS